MPGLEGGRRRDYCLGALFGRLPMLPEESASSEDDSGRGPQKREEDVALVSPQPLSKLPVEGGEHQQQDEEGKGDGDGPIGPYEFADRDQARQGAEDQRSLDERSPFRSSWPHLSR